jgi:hypothetical protein
MKKVSEQTFKSVIRQAKPQTEVIEKGAKTISWYNDNRCLGFELINSANEHFYFLKEGEDHEKRNS